MSRRRWIYRHAMPDVIDEIAAVVVLDTLRELLTDAVAESTALDWSTLHLTTEPAPMAPTYGTVLIHATIDGES